MLGAGFVRSRGRGNAVRALGLAVARYWRAVLALARSWRCRIWVWAAVWAPGPANLAGPLCGMPSFTVRRILARLPVDLWLLRCTRYRGRERGRYRPERRSRWLSSLRLRRSRRRTRP